MLAKHRTMVRSSSPYAPPSVLGIDAAVFWSLARDLNCSICPGRGQSFFVSGDSVNISPGADNSKTGSYADVTIFDPAAILDTATYTDPNQVSKGVQYVLVHWPTRVGSW